MQYLAFGRGMDTTRMRQVLHLEPRFSTRAAFEDFIAQAGTGLPGQAVLASVADSLAGTAAGVLSHAVPTSRSI
jgi:UDP-glucose 4-epimerase